MSYQSETNWMDELDSKLRNLEELEAARAKEAWEKHVVRIKPDKTGLRHKKTGFELVFVSKSKFIKKI